MDVIVAPLLLVAAVAMATQVLASTPIAETSRELIRTCRHALAVVSSRRISDHWKERILPRYARNILAKTLVLLGCFAAFALALAAAFGLASWLGHDLWSVATSWQGALLVTISGTLHGFYLFRDRSRPGDYGPLDRLLHNLVLATPGLGRALHEAETSKLPVTPEIAGGRHVFVCGLARAGTTILLRSLNDSGSFASLTYRDMPFVLAPNVWRGLNRNGFNRGERERAHGDGIMVHEDSPEAFEEVFWLAFARPDYVRRDRLLEHEFTSAIGRQFMAHVAAVTRLGGKSRYLSKNNNNVLRIRSLCRLFPRATMVVPFRHPLKHATSLMQQHARFSERQRSDRFTRRYMAWLGHFEFGLDHLRMQLGERPHVETDPERFEYWLEQWIIVHRHLLAVARERPGQVIPVGYELICGEPEIYWPRLCAALDIPADPVPALRAPPVIVPPPDAAASYAEALRIYEELCALCAEDAATRNGH